MVSSLPIVEATIALRCVLLLVSLWNCVWTWPTFVALANGGGWPVSIGRSVVFLFGAGTVIIQVANLAGQVQQTASPWTFTGLFFYAVAHVLAASGQHTAKRFDAIDRLFPFLSHCMAIADLARVNPGSADELANEARRRVAKAAIDGR